MKKLFIMFALIMFSMNAYSQKVITANGSAPNDAFRYGIIPGLNINMAGMGYQNLSMEGGNFIDLVTNDGTSIAPYFGAFAEYRSGDWWNFQLRLAFDSRNATVQDETYTPNPEFELKASYFTVEPILKLSTDMLLGIEPYIGPVLAFNMNGTYTFTPSGASSPTETDVDIPNFNSFAYGFNVGASYDFKVAEVGRISDFMISPFIEYSMLANQKAGDFGDLQNSIDDIWSTSTIRFGIMAYINTPLHEKAYKNNYNTAMLNTPQDGNVYIRKVDEAFPIASAVFFDVDNQNIPDRYIQLDKQASEAFSERDLKDLSENPNLKTMTRTEQQMHVYYNLLNIYINRMKENDDANVKLVGSAPVSKDGEVLANKIKDYMVNIGGIDENRIEVIGQDMPDIPSGTEATPATEKERIRQENRRVSFMFDKIEMYKPIWIRTLDEASVDNDIIVSIDPKQNFNSWNVIITDEKGQTYSYGPFETHNEHINPIEMLKGKGEGDFKANITINTNNGDIVETGEFALRKIVDIESIGNRFSVIFNYAQSDAVISNENTLRNDMADKIPEGNKVIIHGHTDIIGPNPTNKKLSLQRATEVKEILDNEFKETSKDIYTEALGFGEAITPATFDNSLPEGRFYNRNVIIDVIPLTK